MLADSASKIMEVSRVRYGRMSLVHIANTLSPCIAFVWAIVCRTEAILESLVQMMCSQISVLQGRLRFRRHIDEKESHETLTVYHIHNHYVCSVLAESDHGADLKNKLHSR